jgi:hypothetical protein
MSQILFGNCGLLAIVKDEVDRQLCHWVIFEEIGTARCFPKPFGRSDYLAQLRLTHPKPRVNGANAVG